MQLLLYFALIFALSSSILACNPAKNSSSLPPYEPDHVDNKSNSWWSWSRKNATRESNPTTTTTPNTTSSWTEWISSCVPSWGSSQPEKQQLSSPGENLQKSKHHQNSGGHNSSSWWSWLSWSAQQSPPPPPPSPPISSPWWKFWSKQEPTTTTTPIKKLDAIELATPHNWVSEIKKSLLESSQEEQDGSPAPPQQLSPARTGISKIKEWWTGKQRINNINNYNNNNSTNVPGWGTWFFKSFLGFSSTRTRKGSKSHPPRWSWWSYVKKKVGGYPDNEDEAIGWGEMTPSIGMRRFYNTLWGEEEE